MLLTNISLKWMVIWLRFQVCLKLGWKTLRTEFDILPLVLSANGHEWVIWWCLLRANFNNHNILSQPWNVRVSTGPDIGGAFESSTVIKKTFTFHFLFDAIRPTLFFFSSPDSNGLKISIWNGMQFRVSYLTLANVHTLDHSSSHSHACWKERHWI